MCLSKAASVVSFLGALAIGVAVANFAAVTEEPHIVQAPFFAAKFAPVRAESLLGVWEGTWGYDRARCAIEIDRVDGQKFYGTLRKEGAEIAIVGTLDADGRTVFFEETKVLKLGRNMSVWWLGKNGGTFSSDGRTLVGTGRDRQGTYRWNASKD